MLSTMSVNQLTPAIKPESPSWAGKCWRAETSRREEGRWLFHLECQRGHL